MSYKRITVVAMDMKVMTFEYKIVEEVYQNRFVGTTSKMCIFACIKAISSRGM